VGKDKREQETKEEKGGKIPKSRKEGKESNIRGLPLQTARRSPESRMRDNTIGEEKITY